MNRCFNIHLWLNYEAFLCQTTRARKIHEYPAQLSILSCMCYFLHSSPIPVKQVLYFFTHKVTKCVGAEVLGKVTFLGVLENVLPTMTPEILWKTERDWERERERDRQTDRQLGSRFAVGKFSRKILFGHTLFVLPSSFSPLIQTFLPWKSSLQVYSSFSFINRTPSSKCLESIAEENFLINY